MNNKNIASLSQYHPINKSPNFEIRNIIPQDTSNFLQLQKHLDKETDFMLLYPEERNSSIFLLQDNIQSSLKYGSLFLVIDDGNKLVGYLQASRGRYKKIHHSAYIVVGILAAAAGKGLGKLLFKELDGWARNNNITRLELTVMKSNKIAQRLYSKMGFKIEGVKHNSIFMHGHYIDEYYMAKCF